MVIIMLGPVELTCESGTVPGEIYFIHVSPAILLWVYTLLFCYIQIRTKHNYISPTIDGVVLKQCIICLFTDWRVSYNYRQCWGVGLFEILVFEIRISNTIHVFCICISKTLLKKYLVFVFQIHLSSRLFVFEIS